MSAERDELLRMVQELPDDQVPAALAEVRRHLRPVKDRPTVATFNYDTLLESAIRFPPRKVWPNGTIVQGIHLVRDRPPMPWSP